MHKTEHISLKPTKSTKCACVTKPEFKCAKSFVSGLNFLSIDVYRETQTFYGVFEKDQLFREPQLFNLSSEGVKRTLFTEKKSKKNLCQSSLRSAKFEMYERKQCAKIAIFSNSIGRELRGPIDSTHS